MKLEDQVCSLEYSIKLKKLGIKQDSLFWWKRYKPIEGSTYISPEWKISIHKGSGNNYDLTSAYSPSELGEIAKGLLFDITIDGDGVWVLNYYLGYGTYNNHTFKGSNLADLMAKMILANHKDKEIENGK